MSNLFGYPISPHDTQNMKKTAMAGKGEVVPDRVTSRLGLNFVGQVKELTAQIKRHTSQDDSSSDSTHPDTPPTGMPVAVEPIKKEPMTPPRRSYIDLTQSPGAEVVLSTPSRSTPSGSSQSSASHPATYLDARLPPMPPLLPGDTVVYLYRRTVQHANNITETAEVQMKMSI